MYLNEQQKLAQMVHEGYEINYKGLFLVQIQRNSFKHDIQFQVYRYWHGNEFNEVYDVPEYAARKFLDMKSEIK